MTERWSRVTDGTAYADGSLSFHVQEYSVLEHTPKGVWLHAPDEQNGVHGERRFVLQPDRASFERGSDPGRRFAYPDRAMALWSYQRRKMRQVQHLERQLEKASRLHVALRDGLYEEKEGYMGGAYYSVRDGREDDFSFPEH